LSLPAVGWRQVLKAPKKKGFHPVRQTGRSHIIVENSRGLATTIPRRDGLGKGLLLQIISDCGMTKKEFLALL
jgi:predicted RNA binding protein YcfA (HicA-like mRNA interferase family)